VLFRVVSSFERNRVEIMKKILKWKKRTIWFLPSSVVMSTPSFIQPTTKLKENPVNREESSLLTAISLCSRWTRGDDSTINNISRTNSVINRRSWISFIIGLLMMILGQEQSQYTSTYFQDFIQYESVSKNRIWFHYYFWREIQKIWNEVMILKIVIVLKWWILKC